MSEQYDLLLEKYATLVVRVGVNVQPGQEVVIDALPEQAGAARAVAAEAYRVGASRVSITYDDPYLQRGTLVEDLAIEIRDGTITGATASRGEEAVQAQFELIPRSRHVGEVAIVDADSAVARTGLVYKDMLYDENVGSHVAWGMGYTCGMDGSLEPSPEQRVAEGLNQSDTHLDIVIGSPEVQIDGIHADGSVVAVTRGDDFVLEG